MERSHRTLCFRLPLLFAFIFIWLPCAGSASAQTIRTWTGAGFNNAWSTPANWQNNTVPQPDAGEIIVFPANIAKLATVYDLKDGGHFKQITFDSAYTVFGNNSLAVDEQIAVSSFATTIGNTIVLPGDHPLEPEQANGTTLTVLALSGAGGIVKTGTGTLVLNGTGPIQFTGATVVNTARSS